MADRVEIHIRDRQIVVSRGANDPLRPFQLSTADDVVPTVISALDSLGVRQVRAVLVIPASWAYVRAFDLPQRRPTRAMLGFALEEFLPVDLEQLTCDFLRGSDGRHLGLAVETARLKPLIEALAGAGVYVDRITIDALEAARERPEAERVLVCDDAHLVLVQRVRGQIDGLRVVRLAKALSDEAWNQRIQALLTQDGNAGCACVDLTEARRLVPSARTAEPDELRVSTAPAGEFNLARGELAPVSLGADLLRAWLRTATAALAAMLLLAIGLMVHRHRAEAHLGAVRTWERSLYVRLFPDEPVPAGIGLRIASERRRLEGLTAAESPEAAGADALRLLHDLVAAIPDDLRLDLQEIRIDGANVSMRGRTRDHRDAERLATAVDGIDVLDCPAPRTDRHREGGVQFFLHAAQPQLQSRSP